MNIQILHDAELDLLEGYAFYENQTSGLGDYFLDSVFADIDSLKLFSGAHEIRFGYHRLLTRRFPFSVFYRVNAEVIEVWAVLDCRKKPENIRDRLC
ncbi:MAG: type II toxin-antitoxin system RelE/ParE family toxin [Lentisphaerae bacterium]|jgi:hypothetical protein|nr:type II toxin-antitoxin system RelE/ParE family toxin [Lentisphaerota bacterium]